jgi:hypothetical protein
MIVNPIASILHREKNKDKLNIILFHTDVFFEKALCATGHNFYAWTENYDNGWPAHVEKPDNYHILPNNQADIDLGLDFDLILCQDKGYQYAIARSIGNCLHIPKVLYHNIYADSYNEPNIKQNVPEVEVFTSREIMMNWSSIGYVIEPTSSQKLNTYDKAIPYILTDDKVTTETMRQLGCPIAREGNIYINLFAPAIPHSMYNAMAAGHAIVTIPSTEINTLIKNGHNGLIVDSTPHLGAVLNNLRSNPSVIDSLGTQAQKSIDTNYGGWLDSWNEVFADSKNIIYLR